MSLNDNVKSFFSREDSLRSLLLFGWILRILLFIISQLWVDANVLKENFVGSDSEGYHILTVNLLKTGSFETFGTFRTPGYPLYISFFYSIFGPHPWIVILTHTFLDLFSIYFAYLIGKKMFGIQVGLIAAFLFSIDPHIILFSTTLQSDTLFVFVFLGTTLVFLNALQKKSFPLMIWAGLLLGLSTIIRPITQFFPAVFIIIILLDLGSGASWKFKIKSVLAVIIFFSLGISPWLYRNKKQYDVYALSSIQGANLLFYSAAYVNVVKTGEHIDTVRHALSKVAASQGADEKFNPVFPMTEQEHWTVGQRMVQAGHNPFVNAKIYNKIAGDTIKANFGKYLQRHIQGILNMYFALESRGISYRLGLNTQTFKFDYFASPGLWEMTKGFIKSKPLGSLTVGLLVAIFIMLNYALAILGTIRLIIQKHYFYVFFLLCFIGYFSAVVGVVGLARYKMPIVPMYSILSAYGLLTIVSWWIARRSNKRKISQVTY